MNNLVKAKEDLVFELSKFDKFLQKEFFAYISTLDLANSLLWIHLNKTKCTVKNYMLSDFKDLNTTDTKLN